MNHYKNTITKSLTDLLVNALTEGKTGKKGPAVEELGTVLSGACREVLGSKGFEWNERNWKLWQSLANENEGYYGHIIHLDGGSGDPGLTPREQQDYERYHYVMRRMVVVGGPHSFARWSVSPGLTSDAPAFYRYFATKTSYGLSPENTVVVDSEAAMKAQLQAQTMAAARRVI